MKNFSGAFEELPIHFNGEGHIFTTLPAHCPGVKAFVDINRNSFLQAFQVLFFYCVDYYRCTTLHLTYMMLTALKIGGGRGGWIATLCERAVVSLS